MGLCFKIRLIHHAIDVSIRSYFSAVKIQFFSPHETCLNALFDDFLKESLKDHQAKTIP